MKRLLTALTLVAVLFSGAMALAQTPTQPVTVILNWTDNSNNEDGFNVEKGALVSGPFSLIGSVVANVTTFTDSIAADPGNTQYCYRVNAFNRAGVSPYSNVACFVTPAVVVTPLGPTTLVCTATVTQGSQLSTITCK